MLRVCLERGNEGFLSTICDISISFDVM